MLRPLMFIASGLLLLPVLLVGVVYLVTSGGFSYHPDAFSTVYVGVSSFNWLALSALALAGICSLMVAIHAPAVRK